MNSIDPVIRFCQKRSTFIGIGKLAGHADDGDTCAIVRCVSSLICADAVPTLLVASESGCLSFWCLSRRCRGAAVWLRGRHGRCLASEALIRSAVSPDQMAGQPIHAGVVENDRRVESDPEADHSGV